MTDRRIAVSVVWATPAVQDVVPLELPAGATAAAAVAASGLVHQYALDLDRVRIVINGRLARGEAVLGDGDRVEICRPLVADPKDIRRARAEAKPLAKTRPAARRRTCT
jgi:putative ubiquitin-RnfH superfamily antitoxin RatB of RatAB toxin-antitoxin module